MLVQPPPSSSYPVTALPVAQNLLSSSSVQQPFTDSSISPAPSSSFWDWITDMIKCIFSCFFLSSSSDANSSPASSVSLPPAEPVTTTAVPRISPAVTAPAVNTLEDRVAAAKKSINEHLFKNTPGRVRLALDKTLPASQWGMIIQLAYNGQKEAFAKNWSDIDLTTFLESQAEAFLSNSANRDRSDDILHIQTIIFQKTSDSKINYCNLYTLIGFPKGVAFTEEVYRMSISIQTFTDRVSRLLPNDSERAAILQTFDPLLSTQR